MAKEFIERINKIKGEKDSNSKIRELAIDYVIRIKKSQNFSPIKLDIEEVKENPIKKVNNLFVDKELIMLLVDSNGIKQYYLDGKLNKLDITGGKLLNNNQIVILARVGIFIFHLNKNDDGRLISYLNNNEKSIALKYFYSFHKENISKYPKIILMRTNFLNISEKSKTPKN